MQHFKKHDNRGTLLLFKLIWHQGFTQNST